MTLAVIVDCMHFMLQQYSYFPIYLRSLFRHDQPFLILLSAERKSIVGFIECFSPWSAI